MQPTQTFKHFSNHTHVIYIWPIILELNAALKRELSILTALFSLSSLQPPIHKVVVFGISKDHVVSVKDTPPDT